MKILDRLTTDIVNADYNEYDCNPQNMRDFLIFSGGFGDRQKRAIQLIEDIMAANRKKDLLSEVTKELAKIEYSIRELQPWARDHVVHALLSFILGIYISSKLLRPSLSIQFDPLQWKLAGLFHDVGYPVQIAKEALLKRLTSAINKTRTTIGISRPDVYARIELVNIDKLQNNLSSFDLIQNRIDEWGLSINVEQEYAATVKTGDINHGIVSSLSLLYLLDVLYEKHNHARLHEPVIVDGVDFNQLYFERDIVSACAAIYLHNLQSHCFQNARIDRLRTPIAFLLKLSDTLQQWERPSLLNPSGFPAQRFNIVFEKGALIYEADIPRQEIGKMKADLSVLIASDVEIRSKSN